MPLHVADVCIHTYAHIIDTHHAKMHMHTHAQTKWTNVKETI